MKFHSWHGSRHAIALNILEQFGDNSCQQNDATQLSKHQTLHGGHHIGDECYFNRRFWFAHRNSYWFIRIRHPNVQNARANTKKKLQFATTKPKYLYWTSVLPWKLPNTSYLPLQWKRMFASWYKHLFLTLWTNFPHCWNTHFHYSYFETMCKHCIYIQILAFATELGFVCIVLQHWKNEIQKCVSSKMPIHSSVWRVLNTPQNHKEYLHLFAGS